MQDGCSTCTHPLRGRTSCRQRQCPLPHLAQHVLPPPPSCTAARGHSMLQRDLQPRRMASRQATLTLYVQMVTGGVQGGGSCVSLAGSPVSMRPAAKELSCLRDKQSQCQVTHRAGKAAVAAGAAAVSGHGQVGGDCSPPQQQTSNHRSSSLSLQLPDAAE